MSLRKTPWYPVPPYGYDAGFLSCWHAVNVEGELVATFETRIDCEAACQAVNQLLAETRHDTPTTQTA